MPSSLILAAVGFTETEIAGMFAARFAINFAVSTLVARAFSSQPGVTQTTDSGVRQQIPPANTNSIPMVYGDAYVGGTFVDAVLSLDQQTMYYVMAISHGLESSVGFSGFGPTKMYYGDQLITFSDPTHPDVIKLTDGSGNEDTKIAGNLSIYMYQSNQAGVITGLNTTDMPSTVMGGSDIDASLRWPSSGRQMNGLIFAIVKLRYNRDAGTTNLSPITFNVYNYTYRNNAYSVGDVWYDYMTNTKYGAAMDPSIVDTVSRDLLNAYSNGLIPYTPSGGGATQYQARYTINGVIDTSKDCLSNIDQLMLACDSWNQYNATTGKWAVVVNKEQDTSFAFNDSNIIGDIRISAQDITQSINQIEAQFPNKDNKDQQDFVYLQTPANLLYVNEPVNKYTIKYELVNNSVQAQYLANRQLEQAREDLIVTFSTPYNGIQVDAGDVVSVTNSFYGWDAKLFRVMKVTESSLADGTLGAALELTEYNAQVYSDASITAFTPAPNSNLSSPNYFSNLTAPTIGATNLTVTVPYFTVIVGIPATGRVTGINLYYRINGTTDWKIWATQTTAVASPYTPSSSFTFTPVILPTGNYDFSFTVFNDIGGSAVSPTLSNYAWTTYPSKIGTNVVSASNVVQTSYDLNNQYGGVPSASYIGSWVQTNPGGFAANLTSPAGDGIPLRLYSGSTGVTPYTGYGHAILVPLTYGLPTHATQGSITFYNNHLYTADGSNWNQVYQYGDTITPTFTAQSANTVLAGPTSGSAAVPTFRSLVPADVPTLNQNTTGYAAYLNNGSGYLVQSYSEGSGLLLNGWDILAPAGSSTALRFSNVTNGILGHILNDGTGFKFYNATTGYTPITADSLTVSNNATAAKFVTSSTAAEVFYGNTSNSTPTINLYTSGTVNGYFSATSTGNLNLWNSRAGTGLLLQSGGGVNGLQYYAAGVYNIVLNAGNYNSYSPTLTGTGASGTWGINISGNFNNSNTYLSPTNLNTLNSGYNSAADGSDLWINYRGYNDGFSYFRDFRVGNGKGTQIALFTGSTGNLTITGSYSGSGSGLTGTASSLTAGVASTIAGTNIAQNINRSQLFNNQGYNHNTYTSFSGPPDFGNWFVHQDTYTDGPSAINVGGGNTGQYYTQAWGLGNEYAYGSYAMQFAIGCNVSQPYLWVRSREGGTWQSWTKGAAGYADTVGSITNNTGLMVNNLYAPGSGNVIDGLTTTNFRTYMFGSTANSFAISTSRWNSTPAPFSGLSSYGTAISWAGGDTQGFLAMNYNGAGAIIGGGNGNNINWTATLIHSANIGSQSVNYASSAGSTNMSSGRTDSASYPVVWGTTGSTSQLYSCSGVTIQSSTGTLSASILSGGRVYAGWDSGISGSLSGNNWVRLTGAVGLYYNDYQRGIRASDAASVSYGNNCVYGAGLNGWQGWSVNDANTCILMSSGSWGFYNPTWGWMMNADFHGNTTFGGSVTAYSDLRLKKNVREIDNIIERRNTLARAAIKYERDNRTRIGYGAQTLLENGCSEFVIEADDALKTATGLGTLAVDYGETAAVLAVVSKMTDDRVALLEARIAALENLLSKANP